MMHLPVKKIALYVLIGALVWFVWDRLVLPGLLLVGLLTGSLSWAGDLNYVKETVDENRYPHPPMWSADGGHIVFNAGAHLHVLALDDLSLTTLLRGRKTDGLTIALEQAGGISPAGEIALTRYHRDNGEYAVETIRVDGSRHRSYAEYSPYNQYYPSWSSDGSQLAYHSDVSTGSRTIESGFHVINSDGTDVRTYMNNETLEEYTGLSRKIPLLWSPIGDRIAVLLTQAYGGVDDRKSRLVIYVWDLASSEATSLSPTASLPAWSPDGAWVAFVHYENGIESLAVMRHDGTDLRKIVRLPEAVSSYPAFKAVPPRSTWVAHDDHQVLAGRWVSWSNDGSEIRLNRSPFVTVNTDGSDMRIMWGTPGSLARWSPDETAIAVYLPNDEGMVRLFTMDPDGANKRVLAYEDAEGELQSALDGPTLTAPEWNWESFKIDEVS